MTVHALRLLLVLALLAPLPLAAAEQSDAEARRGATTGLPLPRFVSLRADEVNMRTGPGIRFPIEWVYRRAGLPVEVIDEFDAWRRVRDWEGAVGWVHQSMLRRRRTVRVVGGERRLRRTAEATAPAVARLQVGAIGELESCRNGWCRIAFDGFEGYLRRDDVYGLGADDFAE